MGTMGRMRLLPLLTALVLVGCNTAQQEFNDEATKTIIMLGEVLQQHRRELNELHARCGDAEPQGYGGRIERDTRGGWWLHDQPEPAPDTPIVDYDYLLGNLGVIGVYEKCSRTDVLPPNGGPGDVLVTASDGDIHCWRSPPNVDGGTARYEVDPDAPTTEIVPNLFDAEETW